MQFLIQEKELASSGGPPVRTEAFAPWPYLTEDEIEVACAVLRSGKINYWTGEEGRLFEQEYAAFSRSKYAVAVANGTVALELALHALGIGPGDEVVVPSRTFIASASSVVMRGGRPVIADVDRDSQNLTAETVRLVLSPKTKAVIAVHLAGWPCDMDPILDLAREHNLKVIEDCAQAHGATYRGRPVGSIGDVGAFSFCQDKILTTGGEGGMLTTNDASLWERAWSFKDHGKSYHAVYHRKHAPGFHWLHESFGTNWRLTEMQSALGRVLLKKLPTRVAVRRRLATILDDRFSQIPGLRVTKPSHEFGHSYYKYYVFIEPQMLKPEWSRCRILQAISAEGIPCFTGSCAEIYREMAFSREQRPGQRLRVASELGETSLMFQVHSTLSEQDMHDTACAVEKVMLTAAREDRRHYVMASH